MLPVLLVSDDQSNLFSFQPTESWHSLYGVGVVDQRVVFNEAGKLCPSRRQ